MARQIVASTLGLVLLVVFAVVGFGAADALRDDPAPAVAADASPTAAPPIVRELLGRGLPPSSPGYTLAVNRYTIAPGATLAVHVHPGTQVAWIASGDLTYHVLLGEVPVTRGPDSATAATPESLAAGQTTVLQPGDSIVELPGVVHYGENLGSEPVVIWASTLFEVGQPSAIPVNPEGTPVG